MQFQISYAFSSGSVFNNITKKTISGNNDERRIDNPLSACPFQVANLRSRFLMGNWGGKMYMGHLPRREEEVFGVILGMGLGFRRGRGGMWSAAGNQRLSMTVGAWSVFSLRSQAAQSDVTPSSGSSIIPIILINVVINITIRRYILQVVKYLSFSFSSQFLRYSNLCL